MRPRTDGRPVDGEGDLADASLLPAFMPIARIATFRDVEQLAPDRSCANARLPRAPFLQIPVSRREAESFRTRVVPTRVPQKQTLRRTRIDDDTVSAC